MAFQNLQKEKGIKDDKDMRAESIYRYIRWRRKTYGIFFAIS